MKPKIYGLIRSILVAYAQDLRDKYPGLTIRNETVFASAIRELSRHGYIQLVDGRRGVPAWLPEPLVRTLRRVKYQPIWMPGPRFPDSAFVEKYLWPSMKNGEIVWHHSPSKTAHKKWAQRRAEAARQHRTNSDARKTINASRYMRRKEA